MKESNKTLKGMRKLLQILGGATKKRTKDWESAKEKIRKLAIKIYQSKKIRQNEKKYSHLNMLNLLQFLSFKSFKQYLTQ